MDQDEEMDGGFQMDQDEEMVHMDHSGNELRSQSFCPKNSWSDLPADLLSIIAEKLPIMTLLNFRPVCTAFRLAASTATAKIESTPGRALWLLIFDETSKCFLYDQKHKKKYIGNIPEFFESTCLASYKGWLLLSRKQTMFLFCPFSFAKIPLPDFLHHETNDHIAALSTVPTSKDCVISVINRCDESHLEVNIIDLHKSSTWTTYKYWDIRFGPIRGAIFQDGIFNFQDNGDSLITFNLTDFSWNSYKIVKATKTTDAKAYLSFYTSDNGYLHKNNKGIIDDDIDMSWMNLEDDVTVSVRGTTVQMIQGKEWCLRDEEIGKICEESDSNCRHFKGVWIEPRFYHLSTDLS